MKAITLHQPYASLIANGTKTIETRSWAISIPPRAHRGAHRHPCREEKQPGDLPKRSRGTATRPYRLGAALGVVVATARLAGAGQVVAEPSATSVRLKHGRTVRTDEFGDFSLGRWLWFLEDVEPIEPPQTAKGRQGFWDWDAP